MALRRVRPGFPQAPNPMILIGSPKVLPDSADT